MPGLLLRSSRLQALPIHGVLRGTVGPFRHVSPSASPNKPFDLLKAGSTQAILRVARMGGGLFFMCGCGSSKH
jgi:hypothetical protein